MTTNVTVTNNGPDLLRVIYYDEERAFKKICDLVQVGESKTIAIWNGNVPVFQSIGHNETMSETNEFYSVPPARM